RCGPIPKANGWHLYFIIIKKTRNQPGIVRDLPSAMPRLSLPACLAFGALAALPLRAAAPDYPAVCAALGRNPPPHPYLVFNESDKSRIENQIRTDQASRETFERLRLEGLRYLNATEEPPAPPRPVHSRYV